MENNSFNIGIIGHRFLGGSDIEIFVQSSCQNILSVYKQKYKDLKAVSALSQGADSIFAQAAVSLNIKLHVVIPFNEFHTDFCNEFANVTYKKLRSISHLENRVNFIKRSNLAYKKSMDWIVFKSNIVIVVWDGIENGLTGGTWETIKLCKKINKAIIVINVNDRTINHIHN